MSLHRFRPLFAALFVGGTALAAIPDADTIPGVKDPALVSRFPGSVLVGYTQKSVDEVSLIAGPWKSSSGTRPSGFDKFVKAQGKVTRLVYDYPKDKSGFEVMHNYRSAMQTAGMTIAFSCEKEQCGGDLFGASFWQAQGQTDSVIHVSSPYYSNPLSDLGNHEPRYTLASSTAADGGTTYLAVYVAPPLQDFGAVYVQIVEPAPLATNQINVNLSAEQMGRGIAADGKVALYGLNFDTDKADLRADSKPTLDEMAKLLTQQPALKVFIVGHTDNQGSYPHNADLSQRRADAVVAALTGQYKIDGRRLVAKGVASVAPVASNKSDAGRAKNRRVELVEQ